MPWQDSVARMTYLGKEKGTRLPISEVKGKAVHRSNNDMVLMVMNDYVQIIYNNQHKITYTL